MAPERGRKNITRVALVTGATSLIGRAIVRRLGSEVLAVAIHYFRDRKGAEKIAAELHKKEGIESAVFSADLTIERQAMDLVRRVEKRFKRIDILVNNFGPFLDKPWERLTTDDWDRIFRGNLLSAFYCMREVLPGMRKRKWGKIINLGYSRAEQLVAFPGIAPYAVAKTGLLILTRTIATAEAGSGVTVNMVSPGLIEGGRLPREGIIPEKHMGRSADLAEAVAFLVSDRASSITGTNLVVAGTWKM
jgi:3-oxoacyl-[acyl-carrier protein] reductase